MTDRSGDGGGLPVALPEVPRAIRVKVALILERDDPGLTVELLRVYRSAVADGDPLDLEQAFLVSLGRVLEVWHPEGRRIRWESESQAEALVELLAQVRAVVDGSPISDRSGATDRSRIEALGRALERYEALS